MSEENKQKPIVSFVSIALAAVLIIGSVGWLISNVDEAWGWLLDPKDPVPTATPSPPDDHVDAVLYAECQEQLEEALVALGSIPTDADKAGNAEYLEEAQSAYVRLRDLSYRGRDMFDDLSEVNAEEGPISEEYTIEWRRKAQRFRVDLYTSIEKYRDLGVGDQFVRIHSEIFLAYQWLDRFSDQINDFFSEQKTEGISSQGLNRAEGHLDTARDLLNR